LSVGFLSVDILSVDILSVDIVSVDSVSGVVRLSPELVEVIVHPRFPTQ
jgi:hypothetical protein